MEEESNLETKTRTYFRGNLFESYSAYNAWKMLFLSTSIGVVSEEMANKYVEIQKYHPGFFGLTQRANLIMFVILALHSFDKDENAYSLWKVDQKKTEIFISHNTEVINALRKARNKLFAHRDIRFETNEIEIPSVDNLDTFFKNLLVFYNELTSRKENSSTLFENAEAVKYDIEHLYQNLYRGEVSRKKEIEIRYLWEDNDAKASDII